MADAYIKRDGLWSLTPHGMELMKRQNPELAREFEPTYRGQPPEPVAKLDLAGWSPWVPAPCPVLAAQRVECMLYDGRAAQGVAVAFNWRDGRRSDVVERWRLAPPRPDAA